MPSSHEHRRLCWNNDGSDMLGAAYGVGAWPVPLKSVEQFINNLTKFVEGTDVNSIFYCGHTNEPVWELIQHNRIAARNIAALGPDPDQAVVDFAHHNGMEYFYSIRMNDIHASYFTPKLSYWPPFRREHVDLTLGYVNAADWNGRFQPWIDKYLDIDRRRFDEDRQDDFEQELALREESRASHPLKDVADRVGRASRDLWSWASYDYAKPAVRARFLGIVEEACRRYDLDGIELDWCRMAMFFKQGTERRHIAVMNDFVHQVHGRLAEHGRQRGRPILLAMRVPDSIDLCLDAGLDPETWARHGWMDLLMAGSGLMTFSIPMSEWTQLGHQHGIAVYGCIDRIAAPFGTGHPKFDSRDPETDLDAPGRYDAVHAAAARFWDAGVDGICLYNWHTHHGPTDPRDYGKLPEVARPDFLARADKVYQLDPTYARLAAHAPACVAGQLPRHFITQAGSSILQFKLDIVDDPAAVARARLQMQWQRGMDQKRISVALNGNGLPALTPLAPDEVAGVSSIVTSTIREGWFVSDIPPAALRQGDNELSVTVQPATSSDPAEPVELLAVRLAVCY
jgi:hypothetical protein